MNRCASTARLLRALAPAYALTALLAALVAAPAGAVAQALAPHMAPAAYAVRAGWVVDPVDGRRAPDQVILVRDGVIVEVGTGVDIPDGVETVDLSEYTLLPGLMDAHAHLLSRLPQGGGYLTHVTGDPMARRVLVGVRQAREMLLAGFTTVRNIGNSGNYGGVALRDAVAQGLVWGPTILTAGKIIAPFGGQLSQNPERPGLGEIEYIFADTRDEMIKAVRENVHYGADVIKIVVDDQEYLYSPDDIRVIVDEAARSGRPVAAHVLTDQGARNAIAGGVASLEHAWNLTDSTLDMARDSGVVVVTSDFTVSAMEAYGWSPGDIDELRALVLERTRRALDRGVELVFGSDLIWASAEWDRGGWTVEQLDHFVEAGLSPLAILRMVTTRPARLLGLEGVRGRIAPGYAADIIAVRGDPLDDIAVLRRVEFVMKDGRIAKDPRFGF